MLIIEVVRRQRFALNSLSSVIAGPIFINFIKIFFAMSSTKIAQTIPSQHSKKGPPVTRFPFHSGPPAEFFGGPLAVLQSGKLAARRENKTCRAVSGPMLGICFAAISPLGVFHISKQLSSGILLQLP